MERFSPLRRIQVAAGMLAAIGGIGAVDLSAFSGGGKPRYPTRKPTKLCCHPDCKRPHNTGKPCCSAECFKAWRAGEPLPRKYEAPTVIILDEEHDVCLPITVDGADATKTLISPDSAKQNDKPKS